MSGYVESFIQEYVLSDAFLESQAEKIASSEYAQEAIAVRTEPYRTTVVVAGVASAFFGAYLYDLFKRRR